MPIYLKFEGAKPPVPGSGKSAEYAKWVEVDSYQGGANNTSRGGHGMGHERGADNVRAQEAIITMPMNASAQALWSNSVEGTPMTVLVDFLGQGGKPSDLYLSLVLSGAQISSFSVLGERGGGSATASVSLLFDQMKAEAKGKAATP